MEIWLFFSALILLTCILMNKVTYKLGVPALLVFIALGMFMGVDGFFQVDFSNYELTEQLCTVALIFIIFYGGFGTNWNAAKKVVKPSLLLSTIGVVLTTALTGIFCHFILHIELIESLLIGAVISCTDAASVFSILRSKKLNLKDGTASILELESGSNDPMAYMLTIILIGFMNQSASLNQVPMLLFNQIGYGSILGILIGLFGSRILNKNNFMVDGLETLFVLGISIISFSITTIIGGNGYLATYLSGIIIGNSLIPNKVALVNFFDGLTGLSQIVIFFLLGLLSVPTQMHTILLQAGLIFIWLTFIARPLVVFLLLKPFKSTVSQKLLLSWSGLRGASSIVFSILVILNTSNTTYDIFHISFCICLLSVAFQGSLLSFIAHKLDMINSNENVMKTFNDYQEEENFPLFRILITENHSWINQSINDLPLTDALIVMIRRNNQTIIPNGQTVIESGDELIISGVNYQEEVDLSIHEVYIDEEHPWLNKCIHELNLPKKTLIILIKTSDGTVNTPKGNTCIHLHDTVIFTCETINQYNELSIC